MKGSPQRRMKILAYWAQTRNKENLWLVFNIDVGIKGSKIRTGRKCRK
jgi:superfamily I DNA/RNA helicase